MPNKSARSQTSRNTDDFRIIRGLPKTAKAKLHAAGIVTFAQLAAMSPHEIAAAIGDAGEISAERILRDDWIGQAEQLAASRENIAEPGIEPIAEPIGEPTAESSPALPPNQSLTSFVLELKLNEDKTVRQTRVMHVESGGEEAERKWPEWDETGLMDFIRHQAQIASPPDLSEATQATAPDSERPDQISVAEKLHQIETKFGSGLANATQSIFPAAPPAASPCERPAQIAQIQTKGKSRVEVFPGRFDLPYGSAPSDGDYSVKVLLNPADIKSPRTVPLAYTVTVYARNLIPSPAAKRQLVIGEAQGIIAPTDDLEFDLEGTGLTPGAYRLQASARFSPVSDTPSAQTAWNFAAFVEGGVLQVY